MKRHALTDEQWELIEPLIPASGAKTGRPAKDRRLMLDGIFWVLATGAPWRDLPECFGPFQNVHRYFTNWRKAGAFAKIIEALQVKLDNRGLIDWEMWCVDGASVRATRAAAGADKKVSSATPTSPPTTRWAAAKAGLARNSTLSLTATALPWRSKSRPAKSTKARGRSR
jgi:transposase